MAINFFRFVTDELQKGIEDKIRKADFDYLGLVVSDYAEAVTKKEIGYGHGKPYYDKFRLVPGEESVPDFKVTEGMGAEAFAEHVAMRTAPRGGRELAKAFVQRIFPSSHKKMEELLSQSLKDAKP